MFCRMKTVPKFQEIPEIPLILFYKGETNLLPLSKGGWEGFPDG